MKNTLKKRVGYGLSALVMASTPVLSGVNVFADTTKSLAAEDNGAFVCDGRYIFSDAQKDATVTLASATSDCSIYVSKDAGNVTLDLNDKTIESNTSFATIEIEKEAGLSLKNGTVSNIAAKKATIYNNGNFLLDGATLTKNGADYYVILNHGDIIVNAGTVKNEVTTSSLVDNGYSNYNSKNELAGYNAGKGVANPSMVINGGTFDGGMNTIKNDDGGVLTINDGTFKNNYQVAVMDWHRATINGGTFEVPTGNDKTTVYVGNYNTGVNDGYLEVNGGTFKADYFIESRFDNDNVHKNVEVKIKGGDYTNISKSIINTDTPTARPDISDKMTITGGTFKAAAEDASQAGEEGVPDATEENNTKAAGIVSSNLADILSGNYDGFVLDDGASVSDLLTKSISAEVSTEAVDTENASEAKQAEIAALNEALAKTEGTETFSMFDINVAVLAGGERVGSLSEVPEPFNFTVAFPEELNNKIAEKKDTHDVVVSVLRAHTDSNGEVSTEVLASIKNPEGEDAEFGSDKFSTFVLAATFTERKEESPEVPETGAGSVSTPDTGYFKVANSKKASAEEKNYMPYIMATVIAFGLYGILMKRLIKSASEE